MKKLILAAALTLVSACATAPVYGPSMKANDFGYREQAIEDDRFRISYRDKNGGLAMDRALRRAAELTVANGYDYFTVISRDIDSQSGDSYGPSVGIGGSTRSGNRRSGSSVGVGVSLPLGGTSSYSIARIEIVLGRGIKPQGSDSYSARNVLENLVN